MANFSIGFEHSIGPVSQEDYEKERDTRLQAEDLIAEFQYRFRFRPLVTAIAYAVDFLCRVNDVKDLAAENHFEIELNFIDHDGRVIAASSKHVLAMSLDGLVLATDRSGRPIQKTEQGYILSGVDDWDLGLA